MNQFIVRIINGEQNTFPSASFFRMSPRGAAEADVRTPAKASLTILSTSASAASSTPSA